MRENNKKTHMRDNINAEQKYMRETTENMQGCTGDRGWGCRKDIDAPLQMSPASSRPGSTVSTKQLSPGWRAACRKNWGCRWCPHTDPACRLRRDDVPGAQHPQPQQTQTLHKIVGCTSHKIAVLQFFFKRGECHIPKRYTINTYYSPGIFRTYYTFYVIPVHPVRMNQGWTRDRITGRKHVSGPWSHFDT
jgi:hypothetical protein